MIEDLSHVDRRSLDRWSPEMAVRSAMAKALLHVVNRPGLSKWPQENTSLDELRNSLQMNSREQCEYASIHTLYTLFTEEPGQFDFMVLIKSHKAQDPRTHFKRGWSSHAMFLVKDTTNMWYTGSPANTQAEDRNNSHMQLLVAPDVSRVLEDVAKREGGIWPEASYIEKLASRGKILPYFIFNSCDEETFEFLTIERKEGKTYPQSDKEKTIHLM